MTAPATPKLLPADVLEKMILSNDERHGLTYDRKRFLVDHFSAMSDEETVNAVAIYSTSMPAAEFGFVREILGLTCAQAQA
jgi:hypothetical protein